MSFFVAFATGAIVAALALLVESWSLGRAQFSPPPIAAYVLAGGTATAAIRVVLSRFVAAEAARLAAVAAALAVVWANALYVINVTALAGEPYSSAKSLLYDAVILLPYGLVLHWIARARWLAERPGRGRWALSALGMASLAWSAFVLGGTLQGGDPPRRKVGDPALPDVVLVILDSGRRDHLGFHGYGRPTSPALDTWAARGRVYDAAFSASSWTVPTVVSLLEVRGNSARTNVVDRLADRGYAAGCFTDNRHLTPGSPLTAHFNANRRSVGRWRDPLRQTLIGEIVERVHGGSDVELVDRALAWARQVEGPRFLYVHLMDSHTPFRLAPIDGKRRPGRRIEFPVNGMEVSSDERDDIVARYDAGLRSASDQAARLLAGIAELERPFVAIVTADHGESLGEHGRWFHGTGLSPELLAVPVLAVGQGVVPGRVVATIGHSSVTATLLSAASVPCQGCGGTDLRTSEGDRWVHGGLPPDLTYTVGLGHKLVVDTQTRLRKLYSLTLDPQERTDLAASQSEVARRLAEQRPPAFAPELDAESIERLRAIGYTGK